MFRKQLLILLLMPAILFGMESKDADGIRRARSSLGLHAHRLTARNVRTRTHHNERPQSTRPEHFALEHGSASSTQSESSLCPRILDSPHTIIPGSRCDSPALFGLVNQLLQRPVYGSDPYGNKIVYFDLEEIPEMAKLPISCRNLDEAELIGAIFTDIELRERKTIFKNDSPVKILNDIFAYARTNHDKCVAVLSWQNYRYIVAKNENNWVFVDLQRQSEREEYKAGTHSKIFKSHKGFMPLLKTEWLKLKAEWERIKTAPNTDPFDYDWEECPNEPGLQVSYYCYAE